jgi:hypothetical protein
MVGGFSAQYEVQSKVQAIGTTETLSATERAEFCVANGKENFLSFNHSITTSNLKGLAHPSLGLSRKAQLP